MGQPPFLAYPGEHERFMYLAFKHLPSLERTSAFGHAEYDRCFPAQHLDGLDIKIKSQMVKILVDFLAGFSIHAEIRLFSHDHLATASHLDEVINQQAFHKFE